MSQVHLGVRVSEELADALERIASQGRTSKSEIVRSYLADAVLEAEEPLPAHVRREVERENLKQRNRLKWQKVHFPSNVADRFRRAFEQGDLSGAMGEAAVEDIRDIYVEDAELLFEEEPERREAAVEFVNAVADHAAEAADVSEFDRLDPEEMFDRYAGVEDGAARAGFEAVVEDARERLAGDQPKNPEAVALALSKEHGVSEELASEAVEKARGGGDGE